MEVQHYWFYHKNMLSYSAWGKASLINTDWAKKYLPLSQYPGSHPAWSCQGHPHSPIAAHFPQNTSVKSGPYGRFRPGTFPGTVPAAGQSQLSRFWGKGRKVSELSSAEPSCFWLFFLKFVFFQLGDEVSKSRTKTKQRKKISPELSSETVFRHCSENSTQLEGKQQKNEKGEAAFSCRCFEKVRWFFLYNFGLAGRQTQDCEFV